MSSAIIAQPYAVAAMAYARKTETTAAWKDFFATLMGSESAIYTTVRQLAGDEKPIADALCTLLEVKDVGRRNFLQVVAQNRRMLHIGDMARSFAALLLDAENIAEMHIESAKPLSKTQRQDLENGLARWSGRTVQAVHTENPDLLGGVLVRYKDNVWDASVRGRLERMTVSFGGG